MLRNSGPWKGIPMGQKNGEGIFKIPGKQIFSKGKSFDLGIDKILEEGTTKEKVDEDLRVETKTEEEYHQASLTPKGRYREVRCEVHREIQINGME